MGFQIKSKQTYSIFVSRAQLFPHTDTASNSHKINDLFTAYVYFDIKGLSTGFNAENIIKALCSLPIPLCNATLTKARQNTVKVSPSQGSAARVYRGVSSSRSRLATRLGSREGCTSPSIPSNLRAIRSFLHTQKDKKRDGVHLGLAFYIYTIKLIST